MRPGDGVRDFGQGWKDFARVFESVFGHDHGARAAAPFPHSSARLKGQIGCDDDIPLSFSSLLNAASLRWVALLNPPQA